MRLSTVPDPRSVLFLLAAVASATAQSADLLARACGPGAADMVLQGTATHLHLGFDVAAGDWDGDGDDELLLGTLSQGIPGGAGTGLDESAWLFDFAAGTYPKTLADVAAAQQEPRLVIAGLMPPSPGGLKVAFVGDLDGGGREDIAIGAPFWEDPATGIPTTDEGRVYVFLGETWADVQPAGGGLGWGADEPLELDASQADVILQGGVANARFGQSLAGADVDGDGHADLVVGAPGGDELGPAVTQGVVCVFLGGPCGLALAGDAPCAGPGLVVTQAIALADAQLAGAQPFDRLGFVVECVGDLTGDGKDEVAASALQAGFEDGVVIARHDVESGPGEVWLWSPAGGLAARIVPPSAPAGAHLSLFGFALARLSDVTGDGRPDLAVGAPGYAPAGEEDRGALFLYDGAAAFDASGLAPPRALLPGAGFLPATVETQDGARAGWELHGAGADHDGDGREDLYAGAWGFDEQQAVALCYGYPVEQVVTAENAGRILLLSTNWTAGAAGSVLLRVGGEACVPASGDPGDDNGRFGFAFDVGDLDGDGLPDLLAGAHGLSNPDPTPPPWLDGTFELGRAYVLTGAQVQVAVVPAPAKDEGRHRRRHRR